VPKMADTPVSLGEAEMEYPKLTPSGLDPLQRPIPAGFEANAHEVADRVNTRSPEGSTHA
jgi:hypothetical protein